MSYLLTSSFEGKYFQIWRKLNLLRKEKSFCINFVHH